MHTRSVSDAGVPGDPWLLVAQSIGRPVIWRSWVRFLPGTQNFPFCFFFCCCFTFVSLLPSLKFTVFIYLPQMHALLRVRWYGLLIENEHLLSTLTLFTILKKGLRKTKPCCRWWEPFRLKKTKPGQVVDEGSLFHLEKTRRVFNKSQNKTSSNVLISCRIFTEKRSLLRKEICLGHNHWQEENLGLFCPKIA